MRRTYPVFISAPNTILTAGRQHTPLDSIVSPQHCCQHLSDCVSWLWPRTLSILIYHAEHAHSSNGLIIDSRAGRRKLQTQKDPKGKNFQQGTEVILIACYLPKASKKIRGVVSLGCGDCSQKPWLGIINKAGVTEFYATSQAAWWIYLLTVIDGSVTLCDLCAGGGFRLSVLQTFSARQRLRIFTISTINFYSAQEERWTSDANWHNVLFWSLQIQR